MLIEPQTPAALFAAVAAQHRLILLHIATRIVGGEAAEDIVQEALAKAWASLGQFRRGGARGMRSWLCRVVRCVALDYYRREHARRWTPVPLDDAHHVPAPGMTEDSLLRQEQQERASQLVRSLRTACSADQWATLWHMDVYGGHLRELADERGVALSTAKMWHTRGLRRCRAALDTPM